MYLQCTFLIFPNIAREPGKSYMINHVVYFGLYVKKRLLQLQSGYNKDSHCDYAIHLLLEAQHFLSDQVFLVFLHLFTVENFLAYVQ